MAKYRLDVMRDDGRILIRDIINDKDSAFAKYVTMMTTMADDILSNLPYTYVLVGLYCYGENDWELIKQDILVTD